MKTSALVHPLLLMTATSPAVVINAAVSGLRLHPAGLVLAGTHVFVLASDLGQVIDSIRLWVAGLLAALATLFLTIGGIRYLAAGGNRREMERGKEAMRSAIIGYGLAALAPLLVDILRHMVGL